MDYDPAMFRDAPLGEATRSACSPAVDDDFEGVSIAAPRRVYLQGAAAPVVPVCGAYQLVAAQAIEGGPMVLHVRAEGGPEIDGLAAATDALDEPEIPPPPDAPQPSPEALRNTIVSGYFHVDAQAAMPVPLAPGVYEISVTFGGARSGVARVVIAP